MFVCVAGFEGLNVILLEEVDLGFDGREPDDSSRSAWWTGSEEGRQPVREHVVSEDIGAEDLAQDWFPTLRVCN